MIYLDHAATSWPKRGSVVAAMTGFLADCGANPGRSGHAASLAAARIVHETRERLARLVGLADPLGVAFTKNATEAINLALFGLLSPGDHVVTSSMEHNSVLRPLCALERRGVEVTRVRVNAHGLVDPFELWHEVTPRTRLVIVAHASNVTGGLQPVAEIAARLRDEPALFMVDAAQTAGCVPIDMSALGIDLLAVTGHKALGGPTGTGALCLGPRAAAHIRPLIHGGTGSASSDSCQPSFLPDALEAGTLNTVGIAGLGAAIDELLREGVEDIRQRERALTHRLLVILPHLPGVRVLGPPDAEDRVGIVSFVIEGRDPAAVAAVLEEHGVLCRAGLHCAPLAHQSLGTFPEGAVRLSLGSSSTADEVMETISIIKNRVLRRSSDGSPS